MENASYQNIPVVEAKAEYTRQLKNILSEPVHKKMISIYQQVCNENQKSNQNLMEFQKKLRTVLEWNPNIISNELKKITDACSWFNDLLAAVIVTNVKILTSVKLRKSKKKIQIKMPSSDDFLHKVYINTAKRYFEDPYIIYSKNNNEIHNVIFEAIEDSIRDCLPVQNILQLYLGDAIHGESLNSDDDNESDDDGDDRDDNGNEDNRDVKDNEDNGGDEDRDDNNDDNNDDEDNGGEFNNENQFDNNHEHRPTPEHTESSIENATPRQNPESYEKPFFDKPVEHEVKNLNIQSGGQSSRPSFFPDAIDPKDDEFVGDE